MLYMISVAFDLWCLLIMSVVCSRWSHQSAVDKLHSSTLLHQSARSILLGTCSLVASGWLQAFPHTLKALMFMFPLFCEIKGICISCYSVPWVLCVDHEPFDAHCCHIRTVSLQSDCRCFDVCFFALCFTCGLFCEFVLYIFLAGCLVWADRKGEIREGESLDQPPPATWLI